MKEGVISISVELSGGMEILFSSKKSVILTFTDPPTINILLQELKKLCSNPGLLVTNTGALKPGVLLLVNDVDSELFDDVQLKDGDSVVIISTLHGG